jgi:osmotically-inducible protein OsmY
MSARKSFRPAPTPGQSQLTGRSASLRDRGQTQTQFYLMTPPATAQAQSAQRMSRTTQALARLRANQQAQSTMASQSNYARRSTGSGHKLTLGFTPTAPEPLYQEKESERQGRTLAFVQQSLHASDLRIDRVGNKAILEGTVESEQRARVAEKLALLEPGIYEVENRLQVARPQEVR